ncbi:VapE domain-containing protein [Paraburkholderia sp. BL10I2N1]|uniref:VapE domain-containing protein n=1 Tax=Paraburkholderia sp. BL10I2N1 TaxID=1938796 RepID=UPI00105CCBBF|nr:VapE domain-containing protein [Paraburkholderia sp. BL10I2N1]TDN69083.1 virulence-associated protein E [Paraburkholderia sp. BL10I2N1]
MPNSSVAEKREDEKDETNQGATTHDRFDLQDARVATMEECVEHLKRLADNKVLTPDEAEIYNTLVERRHALIGAIGLQELLERGGQVANPRALSDEQEKTQKEGMRARCRAISNDHKDNLKSRAKALKEKDLLDWVDNKPAGGLTQAQFDVKRARGEEVQWAPETTENNLYRLFDALYIGGKIDEVHYDTAADVVRDENGEEINDRWAVRNLMDAARSVQLKKLSADMLVKTLKMWARTHKMNDIRERFLARLAATEWDGKKGRDQTLFIDLLKCYDTPENRTFTKYWLASAYMRATQPGCYCPTSLVLIGGQHSGKSQFWRLANKFVMCDADASTVNYDPSTKDKTRFLRGISGRAFVGHMGEMKNFGAINTEDWKDFSTGSEDSFDQKFRDNAAVQRQWIFGGDSNEYVGFWRDNNDTDANGVSQGERRLWPLFVHQNADVGDVRWRTDEAAKVDYSAFEYEFFQAMKEIQDWLECVEMEGYLALVDENTRMVREYSAAEKTKDQGTVRVKDFEEAFGSVLGRAARSVGKVKIGEEIVWGVKFFNADLKRSYHQFMPGGKNITSQGITKKMAAFGARVGMDPALKVTCYVFEAAAIYGAEVAAKMAQKGSLAPHVLSENASKLFDAFDAKFLGKGEVTRAEKDDEPF